MSPSTPAGISAPLFPPTSRYYQVDTATLTSPQGKTIVYLKRRFIPAADNFSLLENYIVKQGDRLDNIAARILGDPLAFWRICDANDAMRPQDLTDTPGRVIRITLPQGFGFQRNA